jgi:hypothetical protein
METLSAELDHIKRQEREFQKEVDSVAQRHLSPSDWQFAQQAVSVLETLRTKWELASLSSRQALMQWIVASVVVTPRADNRRQLDSVVMWRGGATTCLTIVRSFDRRQIWDERELEVMRSWYHKATWDDLRSLLPGRTREAMVMQAQRMGLLKRPYHPVRWQSIPHDDKKRFMPPTQGTRQHPERLAHSVGVGQLTGDTLVQLVTRFRT